MEKAERKNRLAKELKMAILLFLFFIMVGCLVGSVFRYRQVSSTGDWARKNGVSAVEQKKIEHLKTVTQLKLCLSAVAILVLGAAIWQLWHQNGTERRIANNCRVIS